jgi:sterol desaturase/sphingolipid hydroxylase (fatty acid hydroxylase superfamily)
MKFLRRSISIGLFPTTFVTALWGASVAFSAGYSATWILALATLGTILTVTLGEVIHPHYSGWGKNHGDIPTDLAHNLVSMVMLPKLLEFAIKATLLGFGATLTVAYGSTLWPATWAMPLQVALALLICQFGEYWAHRLMHEIPLLWRLHSVHHSAPRLYWLNAGRFHPVDAGLLYTISLTPLLLLGASEEVLLLFTTWVSVHGLFQHCNIELKLGPLNYIFSMAELHRWHHSRKLEEANSNYGNNIIFWDIVFGTLHYPKDRQADEDIGLSEMPNFPQDYLGQILAPIRWKQAASVDP